MREMIQQKLTEDQTAATKEREKTKALFNEVVRLGEQLERNSERYQVSTQTLEARLQSMEARYQAHERAMGSLSQKGETGLVQLNDWKNKIDKKVSTLEATFYQLGVSKIIQFAEFYPVTYRKSNKETETLLPVSRPSTTKSLKM